MNQTIKVKRKETGILSSNGKNKLHVVVWEPQCEIKAVLQISHGMIELIDRYDKFARYLASYGIVVAGNDHLGHGKTAQNAEELGYMNAYDGSSAIVSDLHRVTVCLKKAYPDVPFFLLGHSMGSFLARRYLSEYGFDRKRPSAFTPNASIDGFICMGTGSQPDFVLLIARLVTWIEKEIKGERYRSRLLTFLAFSGYNLGIPPFIIQNGVKRYRTTKDWISRDTRQVDAYLANPYCQFIFTVKGFETLFNTIRFIQKEENLDRIPKELPVLFTSGEKDPVGHYGKDVRKLYELYRKRISADVSCYLYEGARHEVLNELEYERTFADIRDWLLAHITELKQV